MLCSMQQVLLLLFCPPALLVRTEAHAWMSMVHRLTPPVYAPLDFMETFVRSALTAVSPTPASTVATVQATAWPSRASVRRASLVSLVMTPPASHPAPENHVAAGAHVSVSLMEPSSAFARNGLLVLHVPCSTGQRPGPSQSTPSLWITECLR